MQVILLERIAKLGQMGDTVRVRDGYARNFLLPQGKALRATAVNRLGARLVGIGTTQAGHERGDGPHERGWQGDCVQCLVHVDGL
mgnify:CR=1 FL=1